MCRLLIVTSELHNEKAESMADRGWAKPDGRDVSAPQPMTGTPIVNEIRRWRFERGEMTQQALADACGVTRQTIIALEAGKYSPSLELAFRIARAFGVGIDEVFRWKTE